MGQGKQEFNDEEQLTGPKTSEFMDEELKGAQGKKGTMRIRRVPKFKDSMVKSRWVAKGGAKAGRAHTKDGKTGRTRKGHRQRLDKRQEPREWGHQKRVARSG